MISTKSKYLNITDKYFPINGNMVKYYLTTNNINKAGVAKKLGVLPTTLYQYFKQDSLQMGILWRLSKAVNHNFLAQMGEFLEIPYETQTEKELKATLAEKEEIIKRMEIEMAVMERMRR